ncbi:hypothetical protein EVAR_31661_1 [Eumeta japonica]|uniref:Uncharacterized protein n=1 Tax=Eumeta variegata TaxID=151549 RepID=A0A4C1VS18_EUMVA|nr:hypothetical protein EVAR_31661_1 [Eumeta japonica]
MYYIAILIINVHRVNGNGIGTASVSGMSGAAERERGCGRGGRGAGVQRSASEPHAPPPPALPPPPHSHSFHRSGGGRDERPPRPAVDALARGVGVVQLADESDALRRRRRRAVPFSLLSTHLEAAPRRRPHLPVKRMQRGLILYSRNRLNTTRPRGLVPGDRSNDNVTINVPRPLIKYLNAKTRLFRYFKN